MSDKPSPRLLRQEPGGHLFVWTEALAKRKDMSEVHPEAPAAASAAVVPVETLEDAEPSKDAILGLTEKDDLEAYGRKHGVELDRRKSVTKLQADLIERLGLE